MPIFDYTAQQDDGKEVRGTINATSKEAAEDALKQLQLSPIRVEEKSAAKAPPKPVAQNIIKMEKPSEKKAPAPPPPKRKDIPIIKAQPAAKPQAPLQRPPVSPIPAKASVPSKPPLPKPTPAPVPPPPREIPKVPAEAMKTIERKAPLFKQTAKSGIVAFTPRKTDAPPPVPAKVAPPVRKEKLSRFPLLGTLRLYAGWLFAWYLLVVALGYYAYSRSIPFDMPIVGGLFMSPLVFSLMLATFLFLLTTSLQRTLHGGKISGAMLSIFGIAAFVLIRYSI